MTKFETPLHTCTFLNQENLRGAVGWGQHEPCFAYVAENAVQFDFTLLGMVSNKTIDRIVLRYDESGAISAPPGHIPGWSNGDGEGEFKPNGCVVVKVPTQDWVAGQVPSGPLQFQGGEPLIRRVGVREWDVTLPLTWQIDPGSMPLVPPGSTFAGSGFGLLLAGGLTINDLTADDSTNCMSEVWNVTVEVSFTVFPDEPFVGPN